MKPKVRTIKLTDEEYANYRAIADSLGITFAGLVKEAIAHYVNDPGPEAPTKSEAPTATPKREAPPKPKTVNTPSSFGMSGPKEFRPISKEKQAGKKK